MRQSDLNRAVARATGEPVTEIERLGFQHIATPVPRRRPFQFFRRRRVRRRPVLQSA